jgi:hypothetical protein
VHLQSLDGVETARDRITLGFGGDAANNGLATSLYFTAGPNDENDGLLGNLSALASDQPGNSE